MWDVTCTQLECGCAKRQMRMWVVGVGRDMLLCTQCRQRCQGPPPASNRTVCTYVDAYGALVLTAVQFTQGSLYSFDRVGVVFIMYSLVVFLLVC